MWQPLLVEDGRRKDDPKSQEEADDELSLRYFHLGVLNASDPMDKFLDLYQETGKGKPFREWVEEDYY